MAVAWAKSGLKALPSAEQFAAAESEDPSVMGGLMLLKELFGIGDIASDWAFVIELQGYRQYGTYFWVMLASSTTTFLTNMLICLMTTGKIVQIPAISEWLKAGKSKVILTLAILCGCGQVESLSMITLSFGKKDVAGGKAVHFGCPLPKQMGDFIAWMGVLTPIVEDIPSFIVTTLYLQQESGSLLAKVNLAFTTLNMIFTILGKVVERMVAKGEEAAKRSSQRSQNPLGPGPDSANDDTEQAVSVSDVMALAKQLTSSDYTALKKSLR